MDHVYGLVFSEMEFFFFFCLIPDFHSWKAGGSSKIWIFLVVVS